LDGLGLLSFLWYLDGTYPDKTPAYDKDEQGYWEQQNGNRPVTLSRSILGFQE
jgi:hypothetical protein